MDGSGRIMVDIPKLYRRTALDLIMYGYVRGVKRALPSMTIEKSLLLFQKENHLSEDQYPIRSARITYQRMQKEEYCNCKKK